MEEAGEPGKGRSTEDDIKGLVAVMSIGSANGRWNGGIRISEGYITVAVAPGVYRGQHILIAEAAIGKPLPPGAEVHHVNSDRSDNANSNLVICESLAYHRLLHVRLRIATAGGNPDTQKICGRCKQLTDRTDFGKCRTAPDGLAPICRPCVAKVWSKEKQTHGGRFRRGQLTSN